MPWYTDRSRYITGVGDCAMKRFLAYHSGPTGYGIQATKSIYLQTGTYLHKALEIILLNLSVAQNSVAATEIFSDPNRLVGRYKRSVINPIIKAYREEASKGMDLVDPKDLEFTINEQAHLIESLVWAWVFTILPRIAKEFKILAVEQELEYDLGDDIVLMAKPDFLALRLSDGKVGLHDFKSTSYFGDSFINEHRDSVQFMVGAVACEKKYGPIDHYYVHALVKGSWKPFEKDSRKTNPRQYSHLVYGNIDPKTDRPTYKGYWIDKKPVWELGIDAATWVGSLPKDILFQQTAVIGPYSINREAVRSFLTHLKAEERRWIERLWRLAEVEEKYGWASKRYQQKLDEEVPRSYNCQGFGGTCSFYGICFREPGWDKPLHPNGKYDNRVPHHEPELIQLQHRTRDSGSLPSDDRTGLPILLPEPARLHERDELHHDDRQSSGISDRSDPEKAK